MISRYLYPLHRTDKDKETLARWYFLDDTRRPQLPNAMAETWRTSSDPIALIYCSSCVTFEKMKFHGIKEYTTGISTRLSLSGAYTADRQTKALEPREYIVAVKERTFHKEHPEFI